MRLHLTIENLRECLLAPATALLLLMVQPAHATSPNEAQLASYQEASETERVKLILHLAKNGKHDQAEWLLQNYPLQGPHAANRTFYLDGLILKARGDHTGAVKKFRAALADDPSLTLVRADLAQTLVVLEQDDSAVYHLKQLAAAAPTEDEAKGVRSFMERVDERSPVKKSLWIAVAPTSNVNYGARNPLLAKLDNGSEFTAPKPAKAFGVAGGASIGYSKRLGNDFSVVAGIGLQGTVYEDSQYSSAAIGESLEIRRIFERGYLGLGLVASQAFNVDETAIASLSYGPKVTARVNVNKNMTVTASAQYDWRDYNDDYTSGSDGTALSLSADVTHYFSPGFSATLLGSYSDVNAGDGYKTYQSLNGGLAVHKELPWGITADVSANYSQSNFDGLMPGIYGVLFGLREDWRVTSSLELTKRDFNILGFAPAVSYTYTFNESTVPLYDFDNHAVDLRFTKDF